MTTRTVKEDFVMTNRQKLLNYIKNGGDEFICSPQIGAGAGFDTKMAGKTWFSQTTHEDTKRAWYRCIISDCPI